MLNGVTSPAERDDSGFAVHVNGTPAALGPGATVADVVARWCATADGIAVACNGDVVPRSTWAATLLHAGDRVEIVTAAAGG